MGFRSRFVCALLLAGLSASAATADVVSGQARVLDGDTLAIAGQRIRLYAIDAPEADQRCTRANGSTWACGAWVARELDRALAGAMVICAPQEIDRYGRTIAQCRVGKTDFGHWLVAGGLARAYRRYGSEYIRAEEAGRGLWAGTWANPADHRNGTDGQADAGPCAIKGNISENGRIYHLRGSPQYGRTLINLAEGERWFCSSAEAEAAGWRAAHGQRGQH